MSKFDGERSSRFTVAVVLLLAVVMFVSATRAQVGPSPSPQARKRMVQAVDKILQEGLHAKLQPAHDTAHQLLNRRYYVTGARLLWRSHGGLFRDSECFLPLLNLPVLRVLSARVSAEFLLRRSLSRIHLMP